MSSWPARALAALLLAWLPLVAAASVLRPAQAEVQDARGQWVRLALPLSSRALEPAPARLRAVMTFTLDATVAQAAEQPMAVYLPHLYDGGRVVLNGVTIAALAESDAQQHVRWRQPLLVSVPAGLLRAGDNRLELDVPVPPEQAAAYIARPAIGPWEVLRPLAQRRAFWVQGLVQVTLLTSLLFAAGMLLLWALRRSEVLYGLYGLACLFWGLRTLTFLVDAVPAAWWPAWRVFHHFTAIGSASAVALFSLRLADVHRPRLERGLMALTLLLPLLALLPLPQAERWLGQASGLFSIVGLGGLAIGAAVWAAWRQRSLPAYSVLAAWGLLLLASAHDYLMYWHADWLHRWLPAWTEEGHLLLRHAVGVLLLTFGVILLQRFVRTLDGLEQLNRTLEDRVAAREAQLQRSYAQLAELERERATVAERQRLMRELHDGLGSQLFVALSRGQRGALAPAEMVDTLKACVADLRLALEALAPGDGDFATAWGDFRFRWSSQLDAAGVAVRWDTQGLEQPLKLPAHTSLQLLRIAQEALTNALRHARARQVQVRLRVGDDMLVLEVEDDGIGLPEQARRDSRGLQNMRARAGQLGAALELESAPGRTLLRLRWPRGRAA